RGAADVSIPGLCVVARSQPRRHGGRQALAHVDRRIPQRAVSGEHAGVMITFMPHWISRFAKDERGVSAVEFAMILPLMLTLYLGGVEVSQGVSIDRKVTLTARTVTDLVSQVSSIDVTGTSAVLGAAASVLAPYPV